MIFAKDLTKTFDGFTALNSLTCKIPEGCIYGMVGSNGAGKSTFLRILSGVYKADSGICEIDGERVWENPRAKSKLAFVPDDVFYLQGASMDRMASLYKAVYPDFDEKTYLSLTDTFKLDRKKNLNAFSKGMRRQASTILALSAKPQYIFFDETFDGLDPVMRTLVKKLICNDVIERKATAIITSHSLRELEDTCDQLALLHKGGLVLESDTENLKTKQFKIQIAFNDDYDISRFKDIDISNFTKNGCVTNMIVKGDKQEVLTKLSMLSPILLEALPLSLEEIFTYEMEALGYSFDGLFEEVE
ncbi:MAG: ABC transporter ATP-binding protein [Ruminococcaceae bacterium]|nr:ABC transporter ATP-binding protein [Oscillospiraceae bacterium]